MIEIRYRAHLVDIYIDGRGAYTFTKDGWKEIMQIAKRNPCWNCGGNGTITRWYKDKDGKNQKETVTCPVCHGTGEKR